MQLSHCGVTRAAGHPTCHSCVQLMREPLGREGKDHMKAHMKFLVVSCVAVLSIGCAAVNIQSNRDSSFEGSFVRLYIYINDGGMKPVPMKTLKEALDKTLASAGIEFAVQISNPLNLDDTSYLEDAVSRRSDGLLIIQAKSAKLDSYGSATNITYDVSLYEMSTSRKVWRAELIESGSATMMGKRCRKTAETIVRGLQDERLIGKTGGTAGPEV